MSVALTTLPTRIAKTLATRHGLHKKLYDGEIEIDYALADFQKVALTGEYEVAKTLFELYLDEDKMLDETDEAMLELIYKTTKDESMGLIIHSVMKTMEGASTDRDKLEASRLLKEILGDEKGPEEMNKLLVTLTKKA